MIAFVRATRRQRGFTLTELMVALVLGALVVLAATAMVVTSRGTYRTQDESTRVQESSRFALELVNRLVRLAGYTDFGDSTQLVPAFYSADSTWSTSDSYALNGPNLVGADNASPTGAGINGSDSLTIRFFGSGTSVAADGNVLDCAGSSVPAPAGSAAAYSTSRAYNVLFVGYDPDNEPSLKCQRQTYDAAGNPSGLPGDTQTLIRGVESFQVLYGEANYSGGDPDLVPPTSLTYRTGIGGVNPVVNWSNVVTVRIAMLIRSNVGAQVDTTARTYDLFGVGYPNSGTDIGAQFPLAGVTLSTSERTRIRRVVETTIFVRNRVAQWPDLN
ncbi:MAG: PilW family protein [Burkholderiaceae bacterium]